MILAVVPMKILQKIMVHRIKERPVFIKGTLRPSLGCDLS